MNKPVLGLIILMAGVGIWYLSGNKSVLKLGPASFGTKEGTASPSPGAQIPTQITIQLNKEGNSGQSGTATFEGVNKKVKAIINLSGVPKGMVQPAHIHGGLCPGGGATKYSLTSLIDGKSETTLNVSFKKFLSQLPLAVNIHKSVAEAGEYAACGNLIVK